MIRFKASVPLPLFLNLNPRWRKMRTFDRIQCGVSYASFLGLFLVLPIVAIFLYIRPRLRRFHWLAGAIVCLLAFAYTTPWDNYAAYRHLWTFAPSFVLGRPYWFGYLPLEEYLFYFAQAIFVCFATVALSRWRFLTPEVDPRETGAAAV